MRTKAFLPAGVALVALLVSLAPLAAADEEDVIAADGAFIPEILVPTSFEDEDGGCVVKATGPFSLTGTLVGPGTIDVEFVAEVACDQLGPMTPVTFEGHGTFGPGMVNGASGTFDLELEGAVDALGNVDARLEIEEGTGGLADLDGELSIAGNFAVGIAYSGQLELDD